MITIKLSGTANRRVILIKPYFLSFQPQSQKPGNNDSDDDQSEHESEKAPLMGSTLSLSQTNKKPEIIANVPKVTAKAEPKVEQEIEHDKVVGAQPVKRRSK